MHLELELANSSCFHRVCYSVAMSKLTLQQEVSLLRSAVISLVGRDSEGEYRPEFVEEVFEDLKRKPTRVFTTPEKFLRDVRNA